MKVCDSTSVWMRVCQSTCVCMKVTQSTCAGGVASVVWKSVSQLSEFIT